MRKKTINILLLLLVLFLGISTVNGKTTDEKEKLTKKPIEAEKKIINEKPIVSEIEKAKQDFIYKPSEKDPFESSLKIKEDDLDRSQIEGIKRWKIDELSLEGIVKYEDGKYRALLKSPQGNPYSATIGDQLYDGEVVEITSRSVVFKQIVVVVNTEKERLIMKELNPERGGSKK